MSAYGEDLFDVHVSTYRWKSPVLKRSKMQQRVLLEARQAFPVLATVLACVEIQRVWRGVLLRRRVLAKYLYRNFKRLRAVDAEKVEAVYHSLPLPEPAMVSDCLQRTLARARMILRKAEFTRWVAYQKYSVYYLAATTISRQWLLHRLKKRQVGSKNINKPFYLTAEDNAAAKIQRAWKGHIGKQIFRFYANLIKLREHCDARLMLRCINPREAGLVDAASGIHLRFRLGGTTFPPTIYYKMYVHSPLVDLGALAPRDYRASKQLPAVMLHSNTYALGPPEGDRSGWYRRVDNNDWRPIGNKDFLLGAEGDTHMEKLLRARKADTGKPFHFSSKVRAQEREQHRKQKRRKWLVQMYTHLQPQQFQALSESAVSESALEEEVAKLLQWSEALDFEEYQRSWLGLATTVHWQQPGSLGGGADGAADLPVGVADLPQSVADLSLGPAADAMCC
eukprot:RCo008073